MTKGREKGLKKEGKENKIREEIEVVEGERNGE